MRMLKFAESNPSAWEKSHIMVDLETMSTEHNAAILSIGAVRFHPNHEPGDVLDAFHVGINLTDQVSKFGRNISESTLMWWMHPDRVPAQLVYNALVKVDYASALDAFAQWFGGQSRPIWGNASTFDNVILRNAFASIHQECPWKFWDDRCYRTLKNLTPDIELAKVNNHDALTDALNQTEHLQRIVARLGIQL